MKPGIDYIGVGVGGCIVNQEKKVLLALRGTYAKNEQGKWEIPGGSVEFGESFEDALKREIREELGVYVVVRELLEVTSHVMVKEKQHWVSPTYICEITQGTPKIMEPDKCDQIGWFSIIEAKKLPLSTITKHDINTLEKRLSYTK